MNKIDSPGLADASVFEQVFKNYFIPLKLYACRFVRDTSLAEDLVQDVFLQLWKKKDELRITTSLNSYLHSAVRNASINFLKNRKNLLAGFDREMDIDDRIEEIYLNTLLFTDAHLQEQELIFELEKSIAKLPARCCLIFRMSRFEHMKNREIAEKLNISLKAVEKQITRALSILREDLSKHLTDLVIILYLAGALNYC